MRVVIASELAKLRTLRSSWVVLGASVLVSPAIAAALLATTRPLRDAPSQIAGNAFALSCVGVGILCATAFATEFQDRTIATTFTLVPARGRVMLAKGVSATIAGALTAILTTMACYALAAVWLHSSGVAWPWTVGTLARVTAGDLVLGALTALVGVGIGGLTQSPPLAGTVMGLLWFGASNLLATFSSFFRHYGLIAAQTALSEPGDHRYSFAGALTVMAAVTGLSLLAGLWRVKHTDIR